MQSSLAKRGDDHSVEGPAGRLKQISQRRGPLHRADARSPSPASRGEDRKTPGLSPRGLLSVNPKSDAIRSRG